MKNVGRRCFILLLLTISATAFAGPQRIKITARAKGYPAVQGEADARGNFTLPNLQSGSYMIEFRSADSGELKGKQFGIEITGGKQPVRQTAVPGEKLGGGGVALPVEVAKAGKLTGRITTAQLSAAPAANGKSDANVKIIKGKRYVWVKGDIGSQMGGKWVPEDEAQQVDKNTGRRSGEMLRSMQDLGGQGAASGR